MWKLINSYTVGHDSVEEKIFLERNGSIYRLRNEFGNMFFEFSMPSGLLFAQTFFDDIEGIASDEVAKFMSALNSEKSALDEATVSRDKSDQQEKA